MSSRHPKRLSDLYVTGRRVLGLAALSVSAQGAAPESAPGSPMHPAIALLDAAGQNVLDTLGPVSTLATCGQCHDTAYILQHNSHLEAAAKAVDETPLLYPFRSPDGAGDAAWLQAFAVHIPGGGQTEPDCFLCHLTQPDHDARLAALQNGSSDWATTATLAATGLVSLAGGGWQWNAGAFNDAGEVERDVLRLQDPADANCAVCHSGARAEADLPVALDEARLVWPAAATGQIASPDLIAASGLNLPGKPGLNRAWDVHAERGVSCTNCHFAPNNPVHARAEASADVAHLTFDPRRLELGEYVQRPSHEFGTAAQCTDCHAAAASHDWLPYAARHMEALACETCHMPQVYAPALQGVDWTVLVPDAQPRLVYRGSDEVTGQVAGFTPVVVARNTDFGSQLAPFNFVTAWYWQYDAAGQSQPVPMDDLKAVYFSANGAYAPEVLAALDSDGDGRLSASETVLDQPAKVEFIAQRLAALGLTKPRIASEVWPYALHHSVATDEWATSDCRACHASQSRLAQPMMLASINPGGGLPAFAGDGEVAPPDGLSISGGLLLFTPATGGDGRYVLGHDRAAWADWLGAAAFVGVLLGVAGHGGLRVVSALRAPRPAARAHRVYMYAVYERFWHWLQTFSILLLLATGLIIHRPDLFAVFSFRHVVVIHNVLAALLVTNAGLSLFYHLASGEIRQYLPRPYGFFDQAITQAKFYLRGIFLGEPHPFEKTPARKLNPLQQATYVAILNVLLPLQVVTGALMWGAPRWPELAARLGGLGVLGPVHSLVAWLFGAFVVAHVYLTTTGRAPLTGLDAMINGWEDVDRAVHAASQEVLPHVDSDGHAAAPEPAPAAAPESAAV